MISDARVRVRSATRCWWTAGQQQGGIGRGVVRLTVGEDDQVAPSAMAWEVSRRTRSMACACRGRQGDRVQAGDHCGAEVAEGLVPAGLTQGEQGEFFRTGVSSGSGGRPQAPGGDVDLASQLVNMLVTIFGGMSPAAGW